MPGFLTPSRCRWAFWLCLFAVLTLSLIPVPPKAPSTGWDKTDHLTGFAALAVLACLAWPSRRITVPVGLLAFGVLIEGLQSLTGYRFAETADVLADALGVGLGLGLAALVKKAGAP